MSTRKQGLLLFALLFFCYAYVHQEPGWNQNSRLDLLHALFVQKTFTIDAYHENTGDKSVHDEHYYSDKAPGIVFLALPAFAVAAGLLHGLDVPLDSPEGWKISDWIATAGSVGLVTALGGVALLALLRRLAGQRPAWITTLAVSLGAAPFPYATMLFSHAAALAFICLALWAVMDDKFLSWHCAKLAHSLPHSPTPPSSAPVSPRLVFAGLCCGFAMASEYTAAIAAGGVLLLALQTGFRRAALLAVGAIPPLLLIPVYNWVCFADPLAFGYHHLALEHFQEMNKGLFGITLPPKPGAAYVILLSPERGLFFWSPFFLLALYGGKGLFNASRALSRVTWGVIVLYVAAISGYYMPDGGAALGPRHLAPMIPFLAVAAAFGVRWCCPLGVIYGALSVLLTGVATLVHAMPPHNAPDPLVNFYWPRLLEARFTETLGVHLGLPESVSVGIILLVLVAPFACAARRNGPKVPDELASVRPKQEQPGGPP